MNFALPVRVYYEDTDAGGVVYYANYLKFMERARTEFLRALGFEQDALTRQHGVLFVVRSTVVDYIKPAYFNEQLHVSAQLTEIKRASLLFSQQINKTANQTLVCTGQVRIACVDAERFRPCAMPDEIQEVLRVG